MPRLCTGCSSAYNFHIAFHIPDWRTAMDRKEQAALQLCHLACTRL